MPMSRCGRFTRRWRCDWRGFCRLGRMHKGSIKWDGSLIFYLWRLWLGRKVFVKWDRGFIFTFGREHPLGRPFARVQDGFQGSVILSRIAAFQSLDEVEGGIAGEVGKCLRDAGHGVLNGWVESIHGVFERASFGSPGAAHAPAGGGHLPGCDKFQAVLGVESVDVLL
jgi:hypothetical protein